MQDPVQFPVQNDQTVPTNVMGGSAMGQTQGVQGMPTGQQPPTSQPQSTGQQPPAGQPQPQQPIQQSVQQQSQQVQQQPFGPQQPLQPPQSQYPQASSMQHKEAIGVPSQQKQESSTAEFGQNKDVISPQEIPGVQMIEEEPSPEISPEVQGWVEKVERNVIAPPKQVVVADQTAMNPTGNYAAQPVIVLPIDKTAISKGMTQNITQSVRWLAEWCLRIIKKFGGIVVYREQKQHAE